MTPPFHACVDVGGTKIAVALADSQSPQNLQLYGHRSEPTIKQGEPDALAQQIIRMVDASCNELGIAPLLLTRIGVSSCGPFTKDGDMLALSSPNICGGLAGPVSRLPNDWTHVPLQSPLAKRFTYVRIQNDAVSALEAERRWGALQGFDHCAYVTWSTGVGVGLCVDGKVLQGKNGNAGHAGHMFVSDNTAALCGCGNTGDVESLVGGSALQRRFDLDANALLSSTHPQGLIDEVCRDVGRMLYNLIITLDLQRISLGGSLFWHHQTLLLPKLRAQIIGKLPSVSAGNLTNNPFMASPKARVLL